MSAKDSAPDFGSSGSPKKRALALAGSYWPLGIGMWTFRVTPPLITIG